jgi:hypothetical protein
MHSQERLKPARDAFEVYGTGEHGVLEGLS